MLLKSDTPFNQSSALVERWDKMVPDGIEMSKIGHKAYSFSKMFSEIRQNDSKAKEKETKKKKKNKKKEKNKKKKNAIARIRTPNHLI